MSVASVVLSLCIFAATFYAYTARHNDHLSGNYLPGIIGTIVFSVLMAWLNYFSFSDQPMFVRVITTLVITLLEAIVFIFLLLFLLVSAFGS
jgi:cation transport ATPase